MRVREFGFKELGLDVEVRLKVDKEYLNKISKFDKLLEEGKGLNVKIEQYRNKRSMDANGYVWVLCNKIAEVIGSTKEKVYMNIVRDVGQFEVVPIKEEAMERWIYNWESKGLGWQVEILGESRIEGYVNTVNYFGSSVYDTREMAILIDEVVREAKDLDVEVITPDELEKMKML